MPLSLEEIKRQAYLQYINKTTSKNFQNNVTIEDGKIYKLISTMIDSISASLTGGGGGEANTASNLGTTADGSGIFAQKVGVDLEFKRINAGFGIGITDSASAVSISASSGSGGEVNTASNIGAVGEGLFAQKVGVDLEFKKIIAGDNIALTPSASGVSISASVTGGSGETNTASNLGTTADGSGIFAQKVGVDLEFKRLFAGDKIGITESASALSISASVTGQANTASNMGAEEDSLVGIFSQKVGDDLQFKLLQQGNNIELTASSSAIEIAVTGLTGEANTASNIGTTADGEGWFSQKVGDDLQFKRIMAGNNIAYHPSASAIEIAVTGLTGEANTASNIGAVGEGLFAQKVGDDLQFKNIIAGDNIALTPSASGISISASVTGGGGEVNTASNTGTGEGTIFKEKSGVDLIFKSLKAGSNVTITNDINEIIISAVSVAVVYMDIYNIVYTTYQIMHSLNPQFSQNIILI